MCQQARSEHEKGQSLAPESHGRRGGRDIDNKLSQEAEEGYAAIIRARSAKGSVGIKRRPG